MLVFAYFGPETALPLTSLIAAAAGIVMMFGRTVSKAVGRCLRPVAIWLGRDQA